METFGSPLVRESEFRNPENFSCGIQEIFLVESWILGFGIRNTDQGMRNPPNDWTPESNPLTKNPESSTWNSEYTAWNPEYRTVLGIQGCGPLGWPGSGSVIRDHSDHGRSNEPMNPLWTRARHFIWSTMIRVISGHWSWCGSSQRNAPQDRSGFWIPQVKFPGFPIPQTKISQIPESGLPCIGWAESFYGCLWYYHRSSKKPPQGG